MKQTLETFIKKVINKHGDKYNFQNSVFNNMNSEITYRCPIHGEVTQIASNVLKRTGCPLCDVEKAKQKRKSGKYAKQKGNRYELKIAKELNELGFKDVVSSRSQDKRADANKVDLVSLCDDLPFNIQIKCTQNTPSYFKIADDCPYKDKPFIIMWNSQKLQSNGIDMGSQGEVVMVPKDYFYDLLKAIKK